MASAQRMEAAPAPDDREVAKRRARWHSFQVIFALLCVGVVLDVITTAMGFSKAGSSYEQNPIGGFLIHTAGWFGLAAALAVLAGICYFSVRIVCFNAARRWSGVLTALVAVAALVRWTAVVTAIVYLVQTQH